MGRFSLQRQSNAVLDRLFGSTSGSRTQSLNEWLENALKRGLDLDEIERDEDGDIPISCGSAVVFASVPDDEPLRIEFVAPLLGDFTMRPEVYQAINSINRKLPTAKAFFDPESNQIVLAAELYVFGSPSFDHLMAIVDILADGADHYDSLLQKRFGGKTMLDDIDDDEFDV